MLTDEDLRLQELNNYDIIFSEPEPAFDRITELIKRVFQVPIVLISFVDKDIQWFKSCIGLNVSQTSRDVSFCSHAIAGDGIMIVPDALADPRFAHNPLVLAAPHIRFYAGAPLINSNGHGLGTLCVIDTQPHPHGLTDHERQTLTDLAAITVSELELRVAMNVQAENIRKLEIAESTIKIANERLLRLSEDLGRSNDDLAGFARICSHDLQAPARTTALMLQLLLKRYGSQFDEEPRKLTQVALDNSLKMVQLVTDVLAYSTAASSDQKLVTRTEVDAAKTVKSVLDCLAANIQETSAKVTSANLPTVWADPQCLHQVFQNLIGNSIHYRGDEPPCIHVSCVLIDDYHVFSVEDNGMGIDAAYCEVIFQPFKRLHGSAKPGSGIGLATCKLLIERSGGRIWVESVPGKGSKFSFCLPQKTA